MHRNAQQKQDLRYQPENIKRNQAEHAARGVAKCGGVDYSWGADALENAHDYTVTMMLYVVYLAYAIAAIVAIIGALQIYFKMTTGEGDVTKSIMILVGACLFMIGAFILFPAFFGYNII